MAMAVLLKNLVARTPQLEDLNAISELMALCESVEHGVADRTPKDLLSHWQKPDFRLANDAWVIVTTREQMVGFACVDYGEYALVSTFVCVHPDYRNRGIGTLLLRMVEMRAREHVHLVVPGAYVVLRGLVDQTNQEAQRLFEREGYKPGRRFLRISFSLAEDTEALVAPDARQRYQTDISLESGHTFGDLPLYDRDGLCSVRVYKTYEKELRPAPWRNIHVEAGSEKLTSLIQ